MIYEVIVLEKLRDVYYDFKEVVCNVYYFGEQMRIIRARILPSTGDYIMYSLQ